MCETKEHTAWQHVLMAFHEPTEIRIVRMPLSAIYSVCVCVSGALPVADWCAHVQVVYPHPACSPNARYCYQTTLDQCRVSQQEIPAHSAAGCLAEPAQRPRLKLFTTLALSRRTVPGAEARRRYRLCCQSIIWTRASTGWPDKKGTCCSR